MAFEYLQHWYVPASQAIRARTADTASVAKSLAAWQHELELHWDRIRVRARAVNRSERHLEFVAEVRLDGLAAEAVRVELYAEPKGETSAFCEPMRCTSSAAAGDPLSFSLKVATERLASDFTPRVVAQQPNARLPAECSLIAWADASFDDVH
jgi:starch phosphorylase